MVTALPIYDEDFVLRRVPTFLPNYVKPDGTISSFAFRLRTGENGLSVDVEKFSSFEKATLRRKDFRLLKLNVGQIRNEVNEGLDVIHDPLPDNEAHALITGDINKRKQQALVSISTEVFG